MLPRRPRGSVRRLACFVLAALGCLAAGAARADCARPDRIALLPASRPMVRAAIGGAAVEMVIDTGAETSSVTPEVAARLDLPADRFRRTLVATLGGQVLSRKVVLPTLQLGQTMFLQASVAVAGLGGPAANGGHDLAGIIGTDLLKTLDVEFDFPHRTMAVFPTGCAAAGPGWAGRYQAVRLAGDSARDLLLPVTLNGRRLMALFDTGSSAGVLSRAAAAAQGVTDDQLAADPPAGGVAYGGDGFRAHRHRFAALTIGGEVFRNVGLDVVDFRRDGVDLLIGADYMHWRRFFIARDSNTLFIQRVRLSAAEGRCAAPPALRAALDHPPPVPASRPRLAPPDKLRQDRVDGCGAVTFRLAADGTPVGITMVAEWPSGYALGQHVAAEVAATRYRPPTQDPATLYFEAHQYHFQ